MKYARQRDVNEAEIVRELEAAGYAVQRLDGAGVPDLLVGFQDRLWLIEVKNPNAKGGGKYNTGEGCLTAAQTKWWSKWRGPAPKIVTSAAEALEHLQRKGERLCTEFVVEELAP